jgi:hypothetical protein
LPGRDEELALRLVDHVHYTLEQYRPDDPRTGEEEIARLWPQVLFMLSRSCDWDPGGGACSREFPRTFRRVVACPLPVPGVLDGLPRRGRMGQGFTGSCDWASCRAPCTSALRSGRSLTHSALSHLALGRAATAVDPNLPSTTAAGEGEALPRHIECVEARKMSMAGKLDQSDHGGIRCR